MSIVVERLGDVSARKTRWLWRGWLPLGALSLVGGPPGTAKSMLTTWVAATVTRGELHGDLAGKPGNVLFVSSEDDLADTIKPRFMAAGGVIGRAFFADPSVAGFDLPGCIEELREFAVENAIRLLVLDPVAARLSDGLNANADKDVRRALEPLVGMLRDLGMTALGITHMRKATTVDAVSAMLGSTAFVGLARSVIATFADEEGSFLMSSAKLNLGKRPETLRYEVVSSDVLDDEDIIETARVRFLGPTDRSVDDVLTDKAVRLSGRAPARRVTPRENAAAFLREILAGGPVLQRDVAEAARAAGHAMTTLARAKGALGVVSKKQPDGWTWELRHPYDLDDEQDDLPRE